MIIFSILAYLTVLLFVIPIPILVLVTSKRHFSIGILKVLQSASIVNDTLIVSCVYVFFVQQLSLFRDALNIGVKRELYWFSAWDIFRRIPFVFTVYLATLTPSSLILVRIIRYI